MNLSVPMLSIVFISINIVFAFAVPTGLYVFLRKKLHGSHLAFWSGVAVFILFAAVLERLVHTVVFKSAMGAALQQNLWLMAIYGGFMAGLFEEGGRYVAFTTVLKKKLANNENALMYGAGHGGIEVALIMGITMINNLVYSISINSGNANALLSKLDPQQQAQMQALFVQLANTPSTTFLFGMLERIAAVVLQISLSVIVWFAVKEKKSRYLVFIAFAIHFLVDMVAVLLIKAGLPIPLIELCVWAMSAVTAWYAWKVWKGLQIPDTAA